MVHSNTATGAVLNVVVLTPILKVVVDKHEEEKFRWRCLDHYPKEHIEALWGRVRGTTAYIYAFVHCEVESVSSQGIKTPADELDQHEDDAAENGLELLGTIHSHPDCDDAVLSEHDVRDGLNTQESIVGICSIYLPKGNKLRKTTVQYWPALRPLKVERRRY